MNILNPSIRSKMVIKRGNILGSSALCGFFLSSSWIIFCIYKGLSNYFGCNLGFIYRTCLPLCLPSVRFCASRYQLNSEDSSNGFISHWYIITRASKYFQNTWQDSEAFVFFLLLLLVIIYSFPCYRWDKKIKWNVCICLPFTMFNN